MTFTEFYDTKKRMSVRDGADHLCMEVDFFEGDDEIIIFDSSAFITRRGEQYHAIIGRDERLGDEVTAASFVYFEHYVWECCDHNEAFLSQFFNEWLTWQGLPAACALELLMGAELTAYQRQWLTHFCDLWEGIESMFNKMVTLYRQHLLNALEEDELQAIREDRAVANDFMDANMIVMDAFEEAYGRELITEDGMSDDDMGIVNKAIFQAEKGL